MSTTRISPANENRWGMNPTDGLPAPSTEIVPASGLVSPRSRLSNVVLPAPLGPSNPVTPASMAQSTPRSTDVRP